MREELKDIWIYIENGVFLQAKSFGYEGTKSGEIVFNTSMSGYQEIISDPSYAGQFVVFTMPEIGNVGCNKDDMESRGAFLSGVFVRNLQERFSNFRGEESLSSFLKIVSAPFISTPPVSTGQKYSLNSHYEDENR